MSRRKSRPKRKPIGTRLKLDAPQKEGYVRRYVNDDPGRLDQFTEAGWEFVRKSDAPDSQGDGVGSRISQHVGVHPSGEPKRAYLMEIDKDWYDEDQVEKAKVADQIDEVINAGVHGVPNAYTPGQAAPTVTEAPVTLRRE